MHPYAIDTDERNNMLVVFVGMSILSAWALNRLLITEQITVPWWLDAPSVLGFFGIYYKVYDKWLWRHSLVGSTPNLEGNWEGQAGSSYDAVEHDITIEIVQTWSRILIKLTAQHSESRSLTASITTEDPYQTTITYEYLNEPKPSAPNTMHAHRGTAILALKEKGNKMEGQYYSGRDRQNHGSLLLHRTTKE